MTHKEWRWRTDVCSYARNHHIKDLLSYEERLQDGYRRNIHPADFVRELVERQEKINGIGENQI